MLRSICRDLRPSRAFAKRHLGGFNSRKALPRALCLHGQKRVDLVHKFKILQQSSLPPPALQLRKYLYGQLGLELVGG